MSALHRLLAAVLLLATAGCGGNKPAWMNEQKDLLDDSAPAVPAAPATATASATRGTEAAPSEQATTAPRPAPPLRPHEVISPQCAGFTPDGGAAIIVVEQRGAAGAATVVQAVVAAAPGDGRLKPVELARLNEAESEDALLGDALAQVVSKNLPAVNKQIEEQGLVTCLKGSDARRTGGFVRKTPEQIAVTSAGSVRVSLRDGGLWVNREGGLAQRIRQVNTVDGNLSIGAVFSVRTGPNLVIVLAQESASSIANQVIFVGEKQIAGIGGGA